MNNNREKLREWFEAEKKRGLVDVKLFPGNATDVPIDEAAAQVLKIVSGESESVDVTNELE